MVVDGWWWMDGGGWMVVDRWWWMDGGGWMVVDGRWWMNGGGSNSGGREKTDVTVDEWIKKKDRKNEELSDELLVKIDD